MVGHDPVVEGGFVFVVAVVVFADVKPDAEGLGFGAGENGVVVFPGAAGSFGVFGRLLVHVGAGVGEDAVVEVGAEPGHGEGGGGSGAAAHGGAGVGVAGELDVAFFAGAGEDLVFDELDVDVVDGVVFESALTALGVAAAGVDHDGDHDGDAFFVDEVVEGFGEDVAVPGAVLGDDEGGGVTFLVLLGDVDPNFALVGDGGLFAFGDAFVDLAVLRLHDEVVDFSLGDAGVNFGFGSVVVLGADDEVGLFFGREGTGEEEGGDVFESRHGQGRVYRGVAGIRQSRRSDGRSQTIRLGRRIDEMICECGV